MSKQYSGADLEISEGVSGSLELQLQPSCKLKTQKKKKKKEGCKCCEGDSEVKV